MKKSLFFVGMSLLFIACGGDKAPTAVTQQVEGVTVEVVTKRDTVSGQQMEYQQDPKTKEYHGYYKTFHANGKIAREYEYRKGVKNGPEKTYDENGKLTEEAILKNDQYEGPSKIYFPNGKVQQERSYVAGNLEGELKSYYESGTLKEVVMFKNSEENGPFKDYYENGKLKSEGSYMSGKEHGLLVEYNDKEEMVSKKKCRDGQCCTFWADGKDVKPANELCAEIIKNTPDK